MVEELRAEIANLTANPNCKEIEAMVERLRQEIAQRQQAHMELNDLYNQQAQSKLELYQKWEELRDELNRRSTPPQIAIPVPDCSGVIAQLDEANRLIQQLQLENTPKDCDREERQIEDLTKAVDTQERKLQELTRQNERLEAKLRERIPANCDKYITEIANLHRSIEQTVEENRRTVNELKDAHEQRVRAESERAGQIQNALDKLKDAHRQLQEKIPEMDRDLPQKHENLTAEHSDLLTEHNDLNRNFRELQAKTAKQEQYNSDAKDRIEEIQREGEAVAQQNSELRQEVRNLNSQIETATQMIRINSAQIGVLGRNRHYLLEKIGSLISECKTDADARQILAEVMDKELEAKEQYAELETQITKLIGAGDSNAVSGMIFKV
jgi:chromosome segregation ATPase